MALLTGTRALVTGATRGLGRAMALALADAGARVAVTSRDRARAEASAVEIGGAAIGVELDVRDAASVTRAVDDVYAAFGGLDLLVNNAGIGIMGQPIVWLASPQAADVHDERIVASTFQE